MNSTSLWFLMVLSKGFIIPLADDFSLTKVPYEGASGRQNYSFSTTVCDISGILISSFSFYAF